MPGEFEAAACVEAFDETDAQGVDGDRAGVEARGAVGVGLEGKAFGQVAVFDHLELSVADDEVADFFQCVGFGNGLAAHLAAGQIVQAQKQGIDAVDQRIIDLEIGKMLDAALAHVFEGATFFQGAEGAAVAVGAERKRVFRAQKHLPIHGKGGHHSLLEEEDIVLGVAEITMLVEERARGGIVHIAGHDVPGDGLAAVARMGEELLGEDLEQRFVLDGGDWIFTRGAVVAQSSALSAGDEKSADLSLGEQFMAATGGCLI